MFELSCLLSVRFVGTSTRSSFLVAFSSLRRHFHTFELSRLPSAHFVCTSTRSSFLVCLRLTSYALSHVGAFSFAFGSLYRYFHTFELSHSPSAHFVGEFLTEIVEQKLFFRLPE